MIPPIRRRPVPVECATPPRPARSAHPSPEAPPAPTTCIVSRRPGLRIHRRPPCCRIRPPNPDSAGRPAFGNAARSASTSLNPRERTPSRRSRGLSDDLAGQVTISLTRSDRARTDRGIGPGFATTPTPARAEGRAGGRCARRGPRAGLPPTHPPGHHSPRRRRRQTAMLSRVTGAHHRSPRRRRRGRLHPGLVPAGGAR